MTVIHPKLKAQSMVPSGSDWEHLFNLATAIHQDSVPGVAIEFGSGPGGVVAMLSRVLTGRRIIGIDCYDSLPPPAPEDERDSHEPNAMRCHYAGVLEWLKSVNCDRVELCHNWVVDWIRDHGKNIDKVAFAHVDLNFYAPTVEAFEWLLPRLSDGAALVVDDLDYAGVRNAVDRFDLTSTLQRNDRHGWCRWRQKSASIAGE